MTYIDQLKYERFISDLDKVINFEMIYAECSGAPRNFLTSII